MTFLSVYNAWVRYAEKQDSAQLLRKLQKTGKIFKTLQRTKLGRIRLPVTRCHTLTSWCATQCLDRTFAFLNHPHTPHPIPPEMALELFVPCLWSLLNIFYFILYLNSSQSFPPIKNQRSPVYMYVCCTHCSYCLHILYIHGQLTMVN